MRHFNPARLREKYDPLSLRMESKGVACSLPDADHLVMRRGGADDAPALKAMLRDRGAFVFLRQPKHVYRILPGHDLEEVCAELLARPSMSAVIDAASVHPGLLPEPTWQRDESAELEKRYAHLGWRSLSPAEAAPAWSAFERVAAASNGSGPEPVPSVVWDISAVYAMSEDEDTEPDLTTKVLRALRSCTRREEPWLVFSDFANAVSFDPFQMDDEVYRSSWMYPVLPRGDYPHFERRTNHSCFVSADFQQGILTYLHEDSLCVFGQDLLDAIESLKPAALGARRR